MEDSDNNTGHSTLNSMHSNSQAQKKQQQDQNNSKTIEKIADLLKDICSKEEADEKQTKLIKPFLAKKVPQISIKDYLERLVKFSKMSDSTIVLILIYIDRICDINNFQLNYFNIHKLILAAMVVAIKYNEDDYYSTSFYAKVGGISLNEMNNLEYEFLSLIDFTLFVEQALFDKYNEYILSDDDDDDD